jgi:hypothetical protein
MIATNDKVLGNMLTEGAFGMPYETWHNKWNWTGVDNRWDWNKHIFFGVMERIMVDEALAKVHFGPWFLLKNILIRILFFW